METQDNSGNKEVKNQVIAKLDREESSTPLDWDRQSSTGTGPS